MMLTDVNTFDEVVSDAGTDSQQLKIGIVQSCFNLRICQELATACLNELDQLGICGQNRLVFRVPGALEIPLILQKLTEMEQFNALIAIGAIIRGETYHFECVANESAAGIMRVQLDTGIPIINAILTTETVRQAKARTDEKGRAAARTAVEMAALSAMLEQHQRISSNQDNPTGST